MGYRLLLLAALVFASGLLQLNGPSLLSGWGLVTVATGLASALLPPLAAAAVVAAGLAAALPLQLASGSVFATVAVAGLLLRPPSAAAASWAVRRWGLAPGMLLLASLSAVLSLGVATVYYGDDGIHAGLAAFDAVTLGLLASALAARDPASRAVGVASVVAYVLLTAFYWSPSALLAVLAAVAAGGVAARRLPVGPAAAAAALLVAGLALGAGALEANLSILAHPLDPDSYSGGLTAPPECGGGPILEGVHSPERLRVVEECIVVEGTVAGIPRVYDDGDYTWDMAVNDTSILSLGSLVLRKGLLHVEVVPGDYHVVKALGGMVCKGDRLVVKGPLVVDTDHGHWSEIHPVVEARLLERGPGPCVSLPTSGG